MSTFFTGKTKYVRLVCALYPFWMRHLTVCCLVARLKSKQHACVHKQRQIPTKKHYMAGKKHTTPQHGGVGDAHLEATVLSYGR